MIAWCVRALLAYAFIASCLGSAYALEPPTDADKQRAKVEFERGLSLLRQKRLDESLAAFQLSIEAFPARTNLQNAALVAKKLGRHVLAHKLIGRLLAEVANLTDEQRVAAEAERRDLSKRIGSLRVNADVDGARVFVDGARQGAAPVRLMVERGKHRVRVERAGHRTFEMEVEVAAREVTVEARLVVPRSSLRRKAPRAGSKVAPSQATPTPGPEPWLALGVGIGYESQLSSADRYSNGGSLHALLDPADDDVMSAVPYVALSSIGCASELATPQVRGSCGATSLQYGVFARFRVKASWIRFDVGPVIGGCHLWTRDSDESGERSNSHDAGIFFSNGRVNVNFRLLRDTWVGPYAHAFLLSRGDDGGFFVAGAAFTQTFR